MTSHCDSNPAQYEGNRRFEHLVHALGRVAGGEATMGLCLNASKAVFSLVEGGSDISRSLVSRKAQNNVTLLGGQFTDRSSHEPGLPYDAIARLRDLTATVAQHLTVYRGFREFDVKTRNRL